MSSSGVIYAIIVGAWAVYLVPMWLRREDELNRARETQRYAAAIKVLAHKEKFERRWAQPNEADAQAQAQAQAALPLAVGQGFVPSGRAVNRVAVTGQDLGTKVGAGAAEPWAPGPENKPSASKRAVPEPVSAAAKPTVTAAVRANVPTGARRVAQVPRMAKAASSARTATAKYPGPRTGLMARRRRVVGAMFSLTTLGALISADLGAAYLWTMAAPALLLSVYIVRLRRDERVRVAARARRRAAAQQARESREARSARDAHEERRAEQAHALAEAYARAEAGAEAQAAAQSQAESEEWARALSEAQTEALAAQQRRGEAARRRSSAAGRARAQAYSQEAPELPRASNG